jgi:hypothetical protein
MEELYYGMENANLSNVGFYIWILFEIFSRIAFIMKNKQNSLSDLWRK